MKPSTKTLILLTTLSALTFSAWSKEKPVKNKVINDEAMEKEKEDNEKMGLMPYVAYDFGSAKSDGESQLVGGLTLGADYTVYRKDQFSSSSKLAIKILSREESNLIVTNEISGFAFLVGQSANYDFDWLGQSFQVFGQGELGYGSVSTKTSYDMGIFGSSITGEGSGSGSSMIADASIGLRYIMDDNVVPSLSFGYRHFKATGLDYEGDSSIVQSLPSELDMSTAYIAFGVGYQY